MKKLILSLLAAIGFIGAASAATGGPQWDRFPTEKLNDLASLQTGAKLFVNHCLNCHEAAFMRYNRMGDIGLTDDQMGLHRFSWVPVAGANDFTVRIVRTTSAGVPEILVRTLRISVEEARAPGARAREKARKRA